MKTNKYEQAFRYGKKLFTIIAGNTLLALAICAFVVPNDFILGGASGISLALQNWLGIRLSIISAVINTFFFLVGWAVLGWEFSAASLVSTIVYPVIVAIFEEVNASTWFEADKTICALFASVLIGVGVGLVIRVGGSTGGMDIPSCILQKYKGIPVGTSMMYFDTTIVLVQVALQGIDGILYAILIIFISTSVINKTIISGESKVELIVISPAYNEIRRTLLEIFDTGVTFLNIETGFYGNEQKAVFSVVYAKKYPKIREAILAIDPKAFVVTADVMEVNGKGYTLARTYEEK